jgi:hypothetical protein
LISCWSCFCDDVRVEEGGKISIMGLYSSLLGSKGPAGSVLAKLCALLRVAYSPDRAGTGLSVSVLLNDRPLADLHLELPPLASTDDRLPPGAPAGFLHVPMEFVPFTPRDADVLRLRVVHVEGEYHGEPLLVVTPAAVATGVQPAG